jgi:pyruvate/2-oxoglutarate dehydrogenase complex dihydrolipoamide dehydrogenase (E3) component
VRASRIAAGYGARVAVAEEYRVGGTCVIRGCVPKKLLVYGSHFAEELAGCRQLWLDRGEDDVRLGDLRDAVPGMSTASTPPIRTRSTTTRSSTSSNAPRLPGPTR